MDNLYGFHNMVGGKYYSRALGHIYKAPSLRSRFQRIQNGRIKFGSTRGMGVGNILSKIFQFAKPLLKVIGHKALNIASNTVSDTIDGENVIDSVKKHAAAEASNTLNAAPSFVQKIANKVIGRKAEKRSISPTPNENSRPSANKKRKRNKQQKRATNSKRFPVLSLLKK